LPFWASRAYLGWGSLLPFALVVVWIWINPRVFSIPTSTDNWASKAVLGERAWLNRKAIPIPPHHAVASHLLNLVNVAGALVLVYGLWALDPWPTVVGFSVMILGKTWFLDRMVWLFEDMIHTSATGPGSTEVIKAKAWALVPHFCASDRPGLQAFQPVLRHFGEQCIRERRGLVRQLLQGLEAQGIPAVQLEGRL